MNKDGYYTSGEFAKKAHVTLRTIRYYDKQQILTPSARSEAGARFYTDQDLARLQQILLLKYLGFSLEDIREMVVASDDRHLLLESLRVQRKLLEERMEELQAMTKALDTTTGQLQKNQSIDWNSMMELIHLTSMERSLKTQYQNATNIASRIRLHHAFSTNRQGWFPWLMEQASITGDSIPAEKTWTRILELGCGNGKLWIENREKLPANVQVILSDISEGMLREAQHALEKDGRFFFHVFDCHQIPFSDESFDIVFANHLLFYCEDIPGVLQECRRVLKPGGKMICSTYGSRHMREITELVQCFNPDIVLAAEALYERFGLENGGEILRPYFNEIQCRRYDDAIELDEAEPLISYILSCHGNQNHLLLNRYKEFRDFVSQRVEKGFHITKDAGVFLCVK